MRKTNKLKDKINSIKKLFKKPKRAKRHDNSKMFNRLNAKTKFKSSRNKFKFFKNKLEFDNNKKINNITIYYYLLGFILILMMSYIVFFSHYFSIKNIEIIRNDPLTNINIAYRSIDDFRYNQIFLTDLNQIKNNIKKDQRGIEKINIRRILPNTIKINISSFEGLFQAKIKDKDYTITKNGVAIPHFDENLKKINILGLSGELFLDYKQILSKSEISRIIEIINGLKNIYTLINIDNISYYKDEAELLIKTKSFGYLIFDLTQNLDEQISKLQIFRNEYLGNINDDIIYLDLRIIERMYYCSSNQRDTCNKNIRYLYNIDKD